MKMLNLVLVILTLSVMEHSSAQVNCFTHLNGAPHFLASGVKPPVDPTEIRVKIPVPLDYNLPSGTKIDIVARLIAADGKNANDNSVPTIVIINGGPGMESKVYRPYNREKGADGQLVPFAANGIGNLLKGSHVVLFDQRGTINGLSTRIDLDKVKTGEDVAQITRLFGSASIARDLDVIVTKLKSQGRKVAVLGQSYGGTVLAHYLTLKNKAVNPDAALFTAAMLPYYQNPDPVQTFMPRREEQYRLNLSLRSAFSEVVSLVAQFRQHLKSLGMNPEIIHFLSGNLGGEEGKWQKDFIENLKRLIQADKKTIHEELVHSMTVPLNYILSSSEFSPGTTDNLASKVLMAERPFENWMVDEYAVQYLPETYLDWPGGIRIANLVDANVPPGAEQPTVQNLSNSMQGIPVLFTFSTNDGAVPATFKAIAQQHFTQNGVTFMDLNGAHRAAITSGAEQVLHWINQQVNQK